MPEWFGWAGKILDVNLTEESIEVKPLSHTMAREYIGGSCMGAKILYEEVEPHADPLGPDNIIIIGQGPLCGTTVPSAGRYEIVTKSPQTGIYLRSNGGGFFGPEMKWAGYDLIIIRGQAKKPVYLWIKDDECELRDASHLWGQDTWVTQEMIREELRDPEIQTLKIGPAGENLSLSSCIIGDLARAAGRGAPGAVWGSKKLKAIAVRGTKGVNIAKPDELMKLCLELSDRVKADPLYKPHTTIGTVGWVSDRYVKGKGLDNIMSPGFKNYYDKNLACFGCPLHCSHFYTVKSGNYKGTFGEGLEGCCVIYGGGKPNVNDAGFLCKFNTMANKLGLHVNNTGHALGWAVQLYKEGIITEEETDGIELVETNQEGLLKLVEKMAYKQGFGDILDEFPVRAAKKIGKGSEVYAPDIKGIPAPGMLIGFSLSWTLAYSVATRGTDHLTGMPPAAFYRTNLSGITEEMKSKMGKERYNDPKLFDDDEAWSPDLTKARLVYDQENQFALHDMTGVCKFIGSMVFYTSGMNVPDFASLLAAVTGHDYTVKDVIRAAEKEFMFARAFNAREGIRRVDDYPPDLHWELQKGERHPLHGLPYTMEDYNKVLDEYYRLRGCDLETGVPTRDKLEELGLNWLADDLTKQNLLPS